MVTRTYPLHSNTFSQYSRSIHLLTAHPLITHDTPFQSTTTTTGVSQFEIMFGGGSDYPRKYLLYNYYYDPAHTHSTYENTVPVAIRNSQYKLLHTYQSPITSDWYNNVDVFQTDDQLTGSF